MLRTHAARSKVCPIVGCDAPLARLHEVQRDDALRDALSAVPAAVDVVWLRGTEVRTTAPPAAASASAVAVGEKRRRSDCAGAEVAAAATPPPPAPAAPKLRDRLVRLETLVLGASADERPVSRRLEELEMFVLTKLNGGLTPPQRVAALEEATADY
jgi:hypothetical protein